MAPEKFDGFFFLPAEEETELQISYFTINEDGVSDGKPLDNSQLGYCWQIAFFKTDENGHVAFDENYEAILGDPIHYVKNLSGCNLYGLMVRKTDKTINWFNDYLKKVLSSVRISDKLPSIEM